MRMSFEPASDSSADSSNTASSANVVAAMNAILVPTASCLPTGRPHWTRSADHSRAILSDHLPAPAQIAGIDSRPVLSVVRAILRPSPSLPSRFSTGTRTPLNRVTPFSMPFRPMKTLRFSTVTPGDDVSTTNAEMPPRPPSCFGTVAITTTSSAMTPLVVQSFTPSRMYSLPSSLSRAVDPIRAGSEPTSGSVSRKAVTAPSAHRVRYSCFCSSVPNILTGSGTPMELCAETSAANDGCTDPIEHQRASVVQHRQAEAAVLLRDLHAEDAEVAEALDVLVGDLRLALDLAAVEACGRTPRAWR